MAKSLIKRISNATKFKKWTPAAIQTAAWYDAADSDTIAETGGAVSQWNDKSGNGYNVAQGTGSAQPTIGAINGLNALQFDGIDDLMVSTSFSLTDPDVQIVAVCTMENGSFGGARIVGLNAGGTDFSDPLGVAFLRGATNENIRVTRNSTSSGTVDITYGEPFIGGMVYDSVGGRVRVNGGTPSSDAPYTGAFGATELRIGAFTGNFLQGDIGEIILTKDVSDDTRKRIEGYLAHKWGLEAQLPYDHPYKLNPPTQAVQQEQLWLPSDIKTTAWYDAADADTIAETAGAVSQWDDKSGDDEHLVQAVGTDQFATGVDTQNGLNVLVANSDYMEKTSFPIPTSGNFAVFSVTEFDASNSNFDGMFGTLGTTPNDFNLISKTFGSWDGRLAVRGVGASNDLTGGPYNGTGFRLFNVNFDWDSSISNAFVDGVKRTPDGAYTTKLDTPCTFLLGINSGLTKKFTGKYGEVIIVEDCSQATRQRIEGYLAHKWGLTANLPLNHPYRHVPPTKNKSGVNMWEPSQLTTSAWYDAADADTITETAGAVSQWDDKSGNGNHATQGAGANQPLTGNATINGLNVLTGNAVEGSADMAVANADTVKSCFAVYDVSVEPSSPNKIMMFGNIDSGGPEEFVRWDDTQTSFDGLGTNTGKYSLNGGSDSAVATGHSDTAVRTGANVIEMVSTNSFALNRIMGRADLDVGPTQFYKLGELLWFDTELSLDDKQKVEGYLAHKWGLVSQLPSTHPYRFSPPTA